VLVVADRSEASWKDANWITLEADVDWIGLNLSFHPIGPVGVTDSGASVGDNLNVVEYVPAMDINVREESESTAERNTSNDKSLSVGVGNKISLGLVSNGVPHGIILFLNLASFRSILFLNLDGPK
jgi:hypothetical protein